MTAAFVYITAKDSDEAKLIGRALVDDRLAACVNILDRIQSLYWWEGKVEEATETVLIAKTDESLIDRLTERVKSLHSYTCPCVVSWPITAGNGDYLNWIHSTVCSTS